MLEIVIEAISNLIPLERFGLNKEVAQPLSIIVLAAFSSILALLIRNFSNRLKMIRTAQRELHPHFDYQAIKKAKQYYIPTQYQNASPSRQEEPGFTHQYTARNKLIPFFLKIGFNQKAQSDRFYLVLADSGMGKTTFMVNLYFSYHSFFSKKDKMKLRLFRFSHPDTISSIKEISKDEAKQTILLLDALDEDRKIFSKDSSISDEEAFKKRVKEIIKITRNFSEVVMTCRTQYFPGQEDDPYELEIKKPDETGFYILNKIYISPFNDLEVKKYLRKKYGWLPFINRKKKYRASRVIEVSRNLVMRPMLLSYIDYLIEEDPTYRSTFETYDTMVTKWLTREAEKRKIINQRKEFILNMKKVSQKIAVKIYFNWKKDGKAFISKESALSIAREHQIELKNEEITGQSLLTFDGVGNWKFAHKSIMEFFLVKEAIEYPKFLKFLSFSGMNMAKKFYDESNPRLKFVEFPDDKNNNHFISERIDEIDFIEKDLFCSSDRRLSYSFPPYNNSPLKANLIEVLNYCNDLNEKYGYKKVYYIDIVNSNDSFKFLNPQGKFTNNVTEIRGFRLPTFSELFFLSEREFHQSIMSNKENSILTSATEGTLDALNYLEWSTDKTGFSFFDSLYKAKFIHETNEKNFINLKKSISNKNTKNSKFFNVKDYLEFKNAARMESNININKMKLNSYQLAFRVVFVP